MGKVTVSFGGTCAHFRNVVPGVPHRVVLPRSEAVRFGFAELPEVETVPYEIAPHFVDLYADHDQDRLLNLPEVMRKGNVSDGIRLQIANATGHVITYDGWGTLPKLTRYVEHFRPSNEVISGGRAMAYFDIFFGSVTVSTCERTQAVTVDVTMETEGEPVLLASPMHSTTAGVPSATRIPLADHTTLTVANHCPGCKQKESFDFLLHYLTAEGGIPRRFRHNPPGTPTRPGKDKLNEDDVAELLGRAFLFPHDHKPPYTDVSAACSNTGYP